MESVIGAICDIDGLAGRDAVHDRLEA